MTNTASRSTFFFLEMTYNLSLSLPYDIQCLIPNKYSDKKCGKRRICTRVIDTPNGIVETAAKSPPSTPKPQGAARNNTNPAVSRYRQFLVLVNRAHNSPEDNPTTLPDQRGARLCRARQVSARSHRLLSQR